MSLIRESVRRMEGYTPGEQPSDPGIIKLNTNENPYPPSRAVGEFLRRFDPALLGRYPDPVCRRLRERIASMHGLSPAQVFVGNGSDEVLALCVRAFVPRPGGSVGSFDPSYSLYPVLAATEDVPWMASPLGPDFEWQPPKLSPGVFFLTYPNAPTGMVYPRGDVEAFCRTFPGVVVVDEAYVDFADDHLMDLAKTHPNVLVSRSLSKSYSLAGLRVGYIAGSEELIAALCKIKDSYNVDRLAQEIALIALGDVEHMRANARKIRATRARVASELERLGCRVWPSQANFIWFNPVRRPAADIFERLRHRRIFIRYFPGPRTGDDLRVTIGTDADMTVFLSAMGEELK